MDEFKIIRSRRKTLALVVNAEAQLIVRAPIFMTSGSIKKFIFAKQDWIKKNRELMKRRGSSAAKKNFIDGEEFLFLGKKYSLEIVDAGKPLVFKDKFFLSARQRINSRTIFINWYKKQAREIISQRIKLLATQMDLEFAGLKITSAQRRWGSCTGRNKINFSWRLILAPIEVVDYVIVHELAHIKEKNHSRNFWKVVENALPDYKIKEKWLRENGHELKIH